MCIAILTLPGNRLDSERLFAGWSRNSHGGGFAYVDAERKKVVIQKGFMKYLDFEKAYFDAFEKHGANSPFLVHMRIRTSGATNDNNTHPFPIKNGALIHNGIMFTPTGDDVGPEDDRKSDTRVFAERLFNILEHDVVVKVKDKLERAVYGNKIAMLWDDGKYAILNERSGSWKEGIWYSNSGCEVYGFQQGQRHNFRD